MSKKKPAKKARAASTSRRKSTKARPSKKAARRPRATAASAPSTVQLKPIKVLVDRAIQDLQKLPPTDATDITIKHLQGCLMAFEDICDPETPGGCAPTMEFPPPSALSAKA